MYLYFKNFDSDSYIAKEHLNHEKMKWAGLIQLYLIKNCKMPYLFGNRISFKMIRLIKSYSSYRNVI